MANTTIVFIAVCAILILLAAIILLQRGRSAQRKTDQEMQIEQPQKMTDWGVSTSTAQNDADEESTSNPFAPAVGAADSLYGVDDEESTSNPYAPAVGAADSLYGVDDEESTSNPYAPAAGAADSLYGVDDEESTSNPYSSAAQAYEQAPQLEEDDEKTVNPYGVGDEPWAVYSAGVQTGAYAAADDDEKTINPYASVMSGDDEETANPYTGAFGEDDGEKTVNPYTGEYDDEETSDPYSARDTRRTAAKAAPAPAPSFVGFDDEETVNPYASSWKPRMIVGFAVEENGRMRKQEIAFSDMLQIGSGQDCDLCLEIGSTLIEVISHGGRLYAADMSEEKKSAAVNGAPLGGQLTPVNGGDTIEIAGINVTVEYIRC